MSAIGNAFPYVRSNGTSAIVYRATDNHIHELSNVGPTGWFDNDLHVITHETVLAASDPWAFLRADNTESVQFVGSDSKLHQFVVVASQRTPVILPAVQPVSVVRPSGYVQSNGSNAVVYITRGSLQPLHQVTQFGMNAWSDEGIQLSTFSNCVSPLSEPFGHVAPGGKSSILFLGRTPTSANRYEVSRSTGSWTLTTF